MQFKRNDLVKYSTRRGNRILDTHYYVVDAATAQVLIATAQGFTDTKMAVAEAQAFHRKPSGVWVRDGDTVNKTWEGVVLETPGDQGWWEIGHRWNPQLRHRERQRLGAVHLWCARTGRDWSSYYRESIKLWLMNYETELKARRARDEISDSDYQRLLRENGEYHSQYYPALGL